MKRKWRLWLWASIGGVALVGCFCLIPNWFEPRHDGQRLSYWLKMDHEDAISSGVFEDPDERAIPWLVSQIKRGPKTDAAQNGPWLLWLANAAPVLGEPLLGHAFEQRNLRTHALFMLSQFHSGAEAAIPTLVQLLRDPDDDDMSYICECLSNALPASLPPLLKAANDSSPVVREHAVLCLDANPIHDLPVDAGTQIIEALLKAMDDPVLEVRLAAVRQLSSQSIFGKRREERLQSERAIRRRTGIADEALSENRYENAPLLAAVTTRMVKALQDPDLKIRDHAISALHGSGEDPKDLFPKVLALLGDPSPRVRESAASFFSIAKAAPELVVGPLRALAGDADRDCRIQAAVTLAAYGVSAEGVVAEQVAALKSNDRAERKAAFRVLQSIGSSVGDEAIRAMVQTLREPLSSDDLASAVSAMDYFDKGTESQMLELAREFLKQQNAQTRRDGLVILKTLAAHHKEDALRAISEAIRLPGFTDEELVGLVHAFEDRRRSRGGYGGARATYLLELLTHPSEAVRIEAIKRLPGDDPRVEAALRSLSDDPSHVVWKAVAEKLDQIERLKPARR